MSEASRIGSSAAGEEWCLEGAVFRAVELEGESMRSSSRDKRTHVTARASDNTDSTQLDMASQLGHVRTLGF